MELQASESEAGERCSDQPRWLRILSSHPAEKPAPGILLWAALVPEPALWWLHSSWDGCPRGVRPGAHPQKASISLSGLCFENPLRLLAWEAHGLARTWVSLVVPLHVDLETMVVASPTLLVYRQPHAHHPAQTLWDRAGAVERKRTQGTLVLSLVL